MGPLAKTLEAEIGSTDFINPGGSYRILYLSVLNSTTTKLTYLRQQQISGDIQSVLQWCQRALLRCVWNQFAHSTKSVQWHLAYTFTTACTTDRHRLLKTFKNHCDTWTSGFERTRRCFGGMSIHLTLITSFDHFTAEDIPQCHKHTSTFSFAILLRLLRSHFFDIYFACSFMGICCKCYHSINHGSYQQNLERGMRVWGTRGFITVNRDVSGKQLKLLMSRLAYHLYSSWKLAY